MTEVQAIITGAIIGGGIALVAAFFSYRWSRSVSLESIRIADFNKAAAIFKNTFLPEIVYLKHNAVLEEIAGRTDSTADLLQSGYIRRHLRAIETFQAILPPEDRRDIQRAWDEY